MTFAFFTYSEMGSGADHAELLSTVRQQHQEQMAQGAQRDQDAKEFVAAIHALASLQKVDQHFEIGSLSGSGNSGLLLVQNEQGPPEEILARSIIVSLPRIDA
ncbi:TPA: hypothetical protein UM046_000476 [Stenotrophomonas maltophilia]|nr:hypothetical protein [Stenotrophomonas maltophilia]